MSSDHVTAHPSAERRLSGKVALITGGARGQGESEAGLFLEHGATVVITGVLDHEGTATAARLGCSFIRHDVTSEADWAAAVAAVVEMHGRLDVLVNNAGIFPVGGVLDTTLADWERVIAINQTGVFLGMQAAGRHMIEQRSGSIINISSIAGMQGLRRVKMGRAWDDQIRSARVRRVWGSSEFGSSRHYRYANVANFR
jgi:3alpha(or 20beta)-hydroxysteroid dehydrogenase